MIYPNVKYYAITKTILLKIFHNIKTYSDYIFKLKKYKAYRWLYHSTDIMRQVFIFSA